MQNYRRIKSNGSNEEEEKTSNRNKIAARLKLLLIKTFASHNTSSFLHLVLWCCQHFFLRSSQYSLVPLQYFCDVFFSFILLFIVVSDVVGSFALAMQSKRHLFCKDNVTLYCRIKTKNKKNRAKSATTKNHMLL